jgi:NAD(P)-dependent dehydrogenase (short-subunit alcohol dehydrogenase family)
MVEGETVIVTGGAGGIGKATVRRLLATGRSVFVIDVDAKALEALQSDLGADGRLEAMCADVRTSSTSSRR